MINSDRMTLRFRVFLLFCVQAVGSFVVIALALTFAHGREGGDASAFVTAAILSAFGIAALTAGIWLMFDENLARPLERLAAGLRASAHAGVKAPVDAQELRYLGDLGPAASAISQTLAETALSTAAHVSSETERLIEEKTRLTALLTEIPVAIVLVNARDEIVLYDGQAAEVLAQMAPPRLNAALTDYFEPEGLSSARRRMNKSGQEVSFTAQGIGGDQDFDARLKPLDGGGYLMIVEDEHARLSPDDTRPMVYDFSLLDRPSTSRTDLGTDTGSVGTLLSEQSFVVFDTETTGLLPHKDEIVQLGAVRVVNGRIVPGEEIDDLVNPGRPIPQVSTRVHRITDAMVAPAPDIVPVAQNFHAFAKGSIIVAHNAPFDMAFIRRHAKRCGLEWDHIILDTVLLSAILYGIHENHGLDALCRRLEIPLPPQVRHTALGDARATAEVFVRMLPMLEGKGLTTLPALLEETRRHGRLIEDLN